MHDDMYIVHVTVDTVIEILSGTKQSETKQKED